MGTNIVTIVKSLNLDIPSDSIWLQYRFWLWLLAVVVVLPVSLLRRMSNLRWIAFLNFVIVLFVCLLIFGLSFTQIQPDQETLEYRWEYVLEGKTSVGGLLSALPPVFFAFTSQQIIFPL